MKYAMVIQILKFFIQVLLRVMFEKGPYTIGVFRKPGNHKKCQDIKSRLDASQSVTADELNVPVATSVFKVKINFDF